MTIEEAFGQALKDLRRERNLSQENLAFASGLDRSFVSQLERGYRKPSLITVFQLAHAFNITPSQLISAVENKCNWDKLGSATSPE